MSLIQNHSVTGIVHMSHAFCRSNYCGGGFFLAREDHGGRFDDSFLTTTFFLKRGSARTHQFHFFFGQDQSTVAQRAKVTVAECFLMCCLQTCFPRYCECDRSVSWCLWTCFPRYCECDRFPHYARIAKSAHSSFIGSRVYACATCTFDRVTGVFYMPLL